MDNTSLIDVAEELKDRMGGLGLHLEGPPQFMTGLSEDIMSDDEDDDDMPPLTGDVLTDAIKNEDSVAFISMTFAVNKLAWSDRVLHPESYVDPMTVDDIDLPSQAEWRQSELKRRVGEGENVHDVLRDLLGVQNDEEE